MKLLLTGFEPFVGIEENPSQLIVEHLTENPMCEPNLTVTTAILPVEYKKTTQVMLSLLEKYSPDLCLMIGVGGPKLKLERVALNLDDSPKEDNAGLVIRGEQIISNAPNAYFTSLPIIDIQKRLVDKGISIEVSNHAGAYICNHVYYIATHYSRTHDLNFPTLFLHVPPLNSDICNKEFQNCHLKSLINTVKVLICDLSHHNL